MEQLRQLGEAVGSINALMAFESELRINPRQCRLLADACALALASVTGEVRAHLRFEDRGGARWRALDPPLRELHHAFRDAEGYMRQCLDPRGSGSWWARALTAHGAECAVLEQHLHAILWCLAVAIEAVDNAAAGSEDADADELARRRRTVMLANKYDGDMLDPVLFQHAHGKAYLVSPELVARMESAWKEDRWLLSQLVDEMKSPAAPTPLTKTERRLADVLAAPRGTLHPASVLVSSEYAVRRRLGPRLKEAHWMGESVAVKHIVGDDADAEAEVALLASVAHPNVSHAAHCFRDAERKEYVVVMDQLMAKDLGGYVKEVCGPRRRGMPFPLLVAVDVMLQIARGMEYLHGRKVCHGELNPSNVLVKPRQNDTGYVHVKVAGYGRSGTITTKAAANGNANNANENACIWYAPEVLDQGDGAAGVKCTEKADVYSFAMICFELLTGKVPFEDNHLQGERTSRNIRAGERPLFPCQAPKYLVSLTKRCWHADPAQRPTFASVCRVLRYVKRFLVTNPDHQQEGQTDAPPVDYLDIEAQLMRRGIPAWQRGEGAARVWDVPFQMFAYRTVEREKVKTAGVLAIRDKVSDSGSDGEENEIGAVLSPDDTSSGSSGTVRSRPASSDGNKTPARKADAKTPRQAGCHQKVKQTSVEKPPPTASRRTPGVKAERPARRQTSTHSSD